MLVLVPAARVVQDRLDDSVRVQVEVEGISNLEAWVQHFHVPLELNIEAQLRVYSSEHLKYKLNVNVTWAYNTVEIQKPDIRKPESLKNRMFWCPVFKCLIY